MRGIIVRMEIGRSMIALNNRNGSSYFQKLLQRIQRMAWLCQVFQDETHENMVEGLRIKGQIDYVPLFEMNIFMPCVLNGSPGFGKGAFRQIDRCDVCVRTVSGENNSLRTNTASSFKDSAPRGIYCIRVQ